MKSKKDSKRGWDISAFIKEFSNYGRFLLTAAEIYFAFRGRLMSLLELRSAGSHRGLCSRRSLRIFPPLRVFVFSDVRFSCVSPSFSNPINHLHHCFIQ